MLGWQVRRLRKKNNVKVIAIAGSIGKTSTKIAIAKVLQQGFKVRYQQGNYNDLVTVPLIFFGQEMPSLLNPFAWVMIFWRNEAQLRKTYPYEIVVVEVGVDGPGQINKYGAYLHADVGVLTAIAPEHMEYFDNLEAVAREELNIENICDDVFVNADLCDLKYLGQLKAKPKTYGLLQRASYQFTEVKFNKQGYDFVVTHNDREILKTSHASFSDSHLYSLCAAVAVANELGVPANKIIEGLKTIQPVSGRMQRLDGINGSVILDDTYNSSPVAAVSALDTLYRIEAAHKIAVLGNMNELGSFSQEAHAEVGKYCDPEKLAEVITLGPDANEYLAKAAEEQGCKVSRFDSPLKVGEYLKEIIKPGSLVLAKGSQNGVFAEEAVKKILARPEDAEKLVRQSSAWLKIKSKQLSEKL